MARFDEQKIKQDREFFGTMPVQEPRTDAATPALTRAGKILNLQKSIGNRAVKRVELLT